MKLLLPSLALSLSLAMPVFAQGVVDLPTLTWPTETVSPASMGCTNPTRLTVATPCGKK
ncbi:hypothetical protein [Pseudorhodobacter sp.]|uniref:hypothetical protein n=1 Tax=Pseudorhodobacter sp. TaxID=1934400 RepID=UPI002649D1EE|nr:hypothetical protein [Pseudorhodobacter sp.]MDN5788923.1 hypothetical protein [Pseudorhodobacter sp.]